eukprot:Plantae.Rhodophyta-Rhodochaete_pulchella.ctg13987.p4 GENE.Plantae.Rhodophyta-Rhodochaete_pulchella.ctg13987~~Plantae.Rhodophyta-Rhodochaete_pulchella.ctg13987.p4  ORF type:complete len:110 (-),score=13.36 Plantae.Rhodophyta-Rhodochaete_pulchella.ctg13987:746-1075(-)
MSAFAGLRHGWRQVTRGGSPALVLRERAQPTASGVAGRRGMATEESVSWGEYRSGKKSLQQWIDANRPIVVVGTLVGWYVVIKGISMAVGGGKKKAPPATEEAAAEPAK